MRIKIHWREIDGRWHGFSPIGEVSTWASLCGRHKLKKLGDGKPLKDIHPWALCGRCDGLEQDKKTG